MFALGSTELLKFAVGKQDYFKVTKQIYIYIVCLHSIINFGTGKRLVSLPYAPPTHVSIFLYNVYHIFIELHFGNRNNFIVMYSAEKYEDT